MKKLVLFENPIEYPGKKEMAVAYGYIFDDAPYSTKHNIQGYIKYLMAWSEVYKDEDVARDENDILVDKDIVNAYEEKIDDAQISFAILNVDEADIRDEDLTEWFLTNEEKWDELRIGVEHWCHRMIIPTIVFKYPICTGNDEYYINGYFLSDRDEDDALNLSDYEKLRLKYLAATEDWVKSGGKMDCNRDEYDGYWVKDGLGYLVDDDDVTQFAEQHYRGREVALLRVEYDSFCPAVCGLDFDILGNYAVWCALCHWVNTNGEWMDIEKLVNDELDVQNEERPVVKSYYND